MFIDAFPWISILPPLFVASLEFGTQFSHTSLGHTTWSHKTALLIALKTSSFANAKELMIKNKGTPNTMDVPLVYCWKMRPTATSS